MLFPPIYEPSANVVFEALAAGLPVVTSALNGAAEVLLEGVHGSVLADPSDIGRLARVTADWLDRGRIDFDTASIDIARNVGETLEILERAAAERGAR
jgi:UDP-glucose:(heptosyl)LPS alpha-1,3-glucosyltransferase